MRIPQTRIFILLIFVGFELAGMAPVAAQMTEGRRSDTEATWKPTTNESWRTGNTSVSQLPAEQLRMLLGLRLPDDYDDSLRVLRERGRAYPLLDLPSRFDWTDSAAVSPVRDQLCGDCWAQASVGALESAIRIYDKDTTVLSVQQVVDCNYGPSGCGGGWMGDTYDLCQVVGAVSRSCYPYVGELGSCATDTCPIVVQIDSWEYIDTTIVSLKTRLMTYGPIAVGMTVYPDFGTYTGGCYEHTGTDSVNHAVLLVGWEDSACGGAGAWHIKNSWSTDWGESGYAWLKYGTCRIGAAATIFHYTPSGPVKLVYDSFLVDDAGGDGDGRPDPGEAVTLILTIANQGYGTATGVSATITTSSPGIEIMTSSASFPDVGSGVTAESDPPHFGFSVDSGVLCGSRVEFVLTITCDQGVYGDVFDLLVGDAEVVFTDDAESDLGWSRSALDDDGTTGKWRRRNPTGSFTNGTLVQPELDHTPGLGTKCFVTSNTWRKSSPDAADVDDGKHTLTTPLLDLSGYASASVCYWRWYTNDTGGPADDVWTVEASGDSGMTWSYLENTAVSSRQWIPVCFPLAEYIPFTDRALIRFVVSDYGYDSTVEAAVDDITLTACPYWVDTIAPVAEVVTPNGGEEIVENSAYELRWNAADDYGIRYTTVTASYDGGLTYSDTIGVVTGFDSTLVWQVPSGSHPDCKIGVEATDMGFNTFLDESDSAFSVVLDVAGIGDRGGDRSSSDRPTGEAQDRILTDAEILDSTADRAAPSVRIRFVIPDRTDVRISIYDVYGRRVDELPVGRLEPGAHSATWNLRNRSGHLVSSGVYFIRLEAGGIVRTAKVVVTR